MSVKDGPNGQPVMALIYNTDRVGIGTTNPSKKLDVAGNINASGALFAGGTQVCTASGCTAVPSDERLKQEITPVQGALEKILQLQGKSYYWKDPAKCGQGKQIGLIAQDVERVFPEVVQTDEKTGLKRVAYAYLVAPLVGAFRALVDRVKNFESQLTQLLNKMTKIQDSILSLFKQQGQLEQKVLLLESQNLQLKAYICAKDATAPFCQSDRE